MSSQFTQRAGDTVNVFDARNPWDGRQITATAVLTATAATLSVRYDGQFIRFRRDGVPVRSNRYGHLCLVSA